ncbi:MAG: branched-chain amino acid ABC transporter permease [Fervidicoccaceae archaeon]
MAFLGLSDPFRFLIDIGSFFLIYSILSISMNLDYGFAGIPNLGKVMFFAMGAIVTGSISLRLISAISNLPLTDFVTQNIEYAIQASEWLGERPIESILICLLLIGLSALASGILGILASLPAIRLKETYLAITLLVTGEILRVIASYYPPLIGGTVGTHVPDFFSWLGVGRAHDIAIFMFMGAFTVLAYLVSRFFAISPFGRIMRAHRENESALSSLGKDPSYVRRSTLFLSSALAGIAGSLYAIYSGNVNAGDFIPDKTFMLSLIIVIGGMANINGPLVGSIIYVFIDRLIRQAKFFISVPFDVNYLSIGLMGAILLIFFFLRPKGILPEKPIVFEKMPEGLRNRRKEN